MSKNEVLTTGIIIFWIFISSSCLTEDKLADHEMVKLKQYLEKQGYASIDPTNSGLYHVVINEGAGEHPRQSDFVIINYIGSFIDHRVFDTSDGDIAYSNGILRYDKLYGPAKLSMDQISIPGLKEGLMLMKEGGKSTLIIPSSLAFGAQHKSGIPPYSTLVYDIGLVKVINDPVEYEKELLDAYIVDFEITATPTASGLFYLETKSGQGDFPKNNSIVTIDYEGSLLDGRVFTHQTEPFDFKLDDPDIFPGIVEGVKKMRAGGEARIIVPWDIGYGADGSLDGLIPPYTTIIFDIKLMGIR
jgi:FKBP-type peptidyl-prolyl cis-trans isomerase FkpA